MGHQTWDLKPGFQTLNAVAASQLPKSFGCCEWESQAPVVAPLCLLLAPHLRPSCEGRGWTDHRTRQETGPRPVDSTPGFLSACRPVWVIL